MTFDEFYTEAQKKHETLGNSSQLCEETARTYYELFKGLKK